MNAAIEKVRFELLRCLPGRLVFYALRKGFHTFRIVGEGPTHWIFLPRDLLTAADRSRLAALAGDPNLAALLCAAGKSKRLCVSPVGTREVGEDFPD